MCVVTFDWTKNDAKEKFRNFERSKSLSWAVVEVTDYCNFSCKWCFANSGSKGAKKMLYLISSIFSLAVIGLGYIVMFPLVPFIMLISFLVNWDRQKVARISMLSSFHIWPFILALTG